eukprot:gnl/TRDRNA2_/TRDRNA2_57542_c0_seq1.p1 gnl/TRDRNA2_/TRDRNA2_57542_c0~~gnl/TRDRNA2_/TRDRNA2_57542_c0_seq1.p1  ORF type:complete len:287 (+),score=62.98 gnl/TRDRNA2_/TRDRNA2_57542_c0_seq1:48-908(+)
MNNVYITGLPATFDEQTCQTIFGPYGNIVRKKVLPSKGPGEETAALVQFASHEEAKWLVDNLNGNFPPGLTGPIGVKFANPSGKEDSGSYGKAAGKGNAMPMSMPYGGDASSYAHGEMELQGGKGGKGFGGGMGDMGDLATMMAMMQQFMASKGMDGKGGGGGAGAGGKGGKGGGLDGGGGSWTPSPINLSTVNLGRATPGWKTKLCGFWEQGKCQRGDVCVFAHGVQELQGSKQGDKPKAAPNMGALTPRYKTQMCKFWEAVGQCHRGAACTYAHGAHELGGIAK